MIYGVPSNNSSGVVRGVGGGYLNHWEKLTIQLKHLKCFDEIRIGNPVRKKIYGILYRSPQITHNIRNFEVCEIQVNDLPFVLYEI